MIYIILILKSRLQSRCAALMVFRGSYFRGESIRRSEVEVIVGKHKNGKAAGKSEVT